MIRNKEKVGITFKNLISIIMVIFKVESFMEMEDFNLVKIIITRVSLKIMSFMVKEC